MDEAKTKCEEIELVLRKVKESVQEYYAALDNRKHGGVAMSQAFSKIEDALGMKWKGDVG